ncbi:uracil-DNA glycosylase [Aureimonas leprariae]|uniref:Type-4 uracil-DNA glycosylase n=1 Tax=Plantimonas leprariae TaxID=2615207 RepID=A0A7V7PPM7_9HYPH|nr:uracil-DNA glycosylase [Aureimonas leprariae]KAB0679922.1 uracil-DNA glycosylase [Aureimonas leprariae]
MTDDRQGAAGIGAAAALLEWYALAGVDVALLDAPRDRFAEGAAEAEPAPARAPERREAPSAPPAADRPPAIERLQVAVPSEVAVADARELARRAESMDALREALAGFGGCNLRLTAKSLVFGDGNPRASVMLIGEAPGREEDISGVPFVGRSGQLLNRMLAAIGIAREDVWVTNTVPWRPPGNRPPTPAETEICLPFVARQIELVRPQVLVCFGSPATKAILQAEDGILRLRGHWLGYSFGLEADQTIPAMPMLHPAYLLRQPAQKRLAWRDLLALKARLAPEMG